jgi:hypothetical protein
MFSLWLKSIEKNFPTSCWVTSLSSNIALVGLQSQNEYVHRSNDIRIWRRIVLVVEHLHHDGLLGQLLLAVLLQVGLHKVLLPGAADLMRVDNGLEFIKL